MKQPPSKAPGNTNAVDAISAYLQEKSSREGSPSAAEPAPTDMVGASELLRALAEGPKPVAELQSQLNVGFAQFAAVATALGNAGLVTTSTSGTEERMQLTSQGSALLPILGG